MSELSLSRALARAEKRLRASERKPRSDRGSARLPPRVEATIQRLLSTRERPSVQQVRADVARYCARRGLEPPARSSIYNAIQRAVPANLAWESLPPDVERCLYNLRSVDSGDPPPDQVPADQVVFYAFNYGSLRAISYASGLGWLALVKADQRRGWRPKSHALLRAVMRYRGIT